MSRASKERERIERVKEALLKKLPDDFKMGFIKCHTGKWEPGVGICPHIWDGAKPELYIPPVPYQGKYGQAFCAGCVEAMRLAGNDQKKRDAVEFRIVCWTCFQKTGALAAAVGK